MAFKLRKKEEFSYSSPQEMFQDNKNKKSMGLLDYQSAVLDSYMENMDKKDLAIELPTGSGKTLVGLLIGEYRRRKNNEKVLFLCPTNQLVHQVVEQANEKYGLKAVAFCGKQKEYTQKDKFNFLSNEVIGVTTYSSFFAANSFFQDVSILIMDDVHSAEDYIVSNWTIQIERGTTIFLEIAELLKPVISDMDYMCLMEEEDENIKPMSSCNMVPMPLFMDKIQELNIILNNGIESGSKNRFAYERIAENLQECNIYIENGKILIRPWIAPTMTVDNFSKVKQRILMSATLGKSGELERVTGIKRIKRLPVVNDWDKKGLGRKFFVFPDIFQEKLDTNEVIAGLQELCKKSVFLVPDSRSEREIEELYEENMEDTQVFHAKDIEESKQEFLAAPDATAILANRLDGMDFADDESRLLFIRNLPVTTNLQEKFLSSRMGASVLYWERIKTRIIQAVGRCSRNPSDYSIVCVMGNAINKELVDRNNNKKFPPELRAELEFGAMNSADYTSVDDLLEQAEAFWNRTDAWKVAEENIIEMRNDFCKQDDNDEKQVNEKLQTSAGLELEFQYALWNRRYADAFDFASQIVSVLNVPLLSGYQSYWNYMAGCMAYYLFKEGNTEYKTKGSQFLLEAAKANISIKWLSGLPKKIFAVQDEIEEDDFFYDCIERMENVFLSTSTLQKFEKQIKAVIDDLQSANGIAFERGHQKLGELLGYISENPNTSGSPDPYWIINEDNIIVAEDKIYEEKNPVKAVPINAVTESGRHPKWITEYEKNISKKACIYNIMITNSKSIAEDTGIYAEDIYYVQRDEFVKWAIKALDGVRYAYKLFHVEGDMEWRNAIHQKFVQAEITPKNYIEFISRQKLKDLY